MNKIRIRKSLEIIYPLILFLLINYGVVFIIKLAGIKIQPTQVIIPLAIVQIIALITILLIYQFQNKEMERSHYKLNDFGFKNIILTLLGTYFVLNTIGLIVIIFQLNEHFPDYAQSFSNITTSPLILQILAIGILAPVTEEFLFRGIIYSRMREISAFPIAALISSSLWAVAHLNVVQGVTTFIFGFFLAFIYERFKTLRATIACHIIMNMIAIISNHFIAASGGNTVSNTVATNPLYINIISLIIDLAIVYVLLHFLNKSQFPHKPKAVLQVDTSTEES